MRMYECRLHTRTLRAVATGAELDAGARPIQTHNISHPSCGVLCYVSIGRPSLTKLCAVPCYVWSGHPLSSMPCFVLRDVPDRRARPGVANLMDSGALLMMIIIIISS